MRDLLGARRHAARRSARRPATPPSVFMIGWALGGVIFGVLGDRLGRAKTMMMTILVLHDLHRPERVRHRRLGFQRLPLPVRPGRGRPVRGGRGAGGGGGAGARAALRAGHGAGVLRRGQHDGGARRDPAGPAGAGGHDRRRLALHVPGRRAAGAAGAGGLQETEGAGAVAQGARRKEADGLVPRAAARRPALAAQLDRRHAAGVRRRGGAVGHRLLQLRPAAAAAGSSFPRAGLTRRGAGRQDHHVDRHHFAAAELRRLLRRPRLHLADARTPTAGRRSPSASWPPWA